MWKRLLLLFLQFSQQNFSSETVTFYLRVQTFVAKATAQTAQPHAMQSLLSEAQLLHSTFTQADAPFEVNLSADVRGKIQAELDRIDVNNPAEARQSLISLFDDAKAGELHPIPSEL